MLKINLAPYSIKKVSRKNERGSVVFELIPILVIFIIFVTYTFGFFYTIHSGILYSIAARNYAFETFRHRANLKYFRGNRGSTSLNHARYQLTQVRIHAISNPNSSKRFQGTERRISFFNTRDRFASNTSAATNYHNEDIHSDIQPRVRYNKGEGVNPVWLKMQYGICINTECGS